MYPSLESWQAACQMMRNENRRLCSYIQWYPFSRLSESSWSLLSSEGYYKKYVCDASFMLCEKMRFSTRGYIQKQGSSMRDSYLVSPVMYLYLLAYGIEYEKCFVEPRALSTVFYAGDLKRGKAGYRRSWQAYCSALKYASSMFACCLKTDISNFFGTINVDSLVSKMQKCSGGTYSATDGFFLKALLLYCGAGRFPTIQNHPTLSFLATEVFLGDVDLRLSERLSKIVGFGNFELVRYVDDLFIFFDARDGSSLSRTKRSIINSYADILRQEGLILNQDKLKMMSAGDVMSSMATVSCVDFSGVSLEGKIALPNNVMSLFFDELAEKAKCDDYCHRDLLDVIDSCFKVESPPVSPMTVFRHCLFRESKLFTSRSVIESMRSAVECCNDLFAYNTSDLVTCVLNTRDEFLVKTLLNKLFLSSRSGEWSSLDVVISITYLLHRGMGHHDLRKLLGQEEPGLSEYCEVYCRNDFTRIAVSNQDEKTIKILRGDRVSVVQFVQSLCHGKSDNLFESASYRRAYFDRFSTLVARRINKRKTKWLYHEKDLKKIYAGVDGAEEKIAEMEKVRRGTPLVHAGSEVLESPTYKNDLESVISSIEQIQHNYLEGIALEDID